MLLSWNGKVVLRVDPKKRFKDCIKVMLDNLEVSQNWNELVQDRNEWRQIVNSSDVNKKPCWQHELANRQLSVFNVCVRVRDSRMNRVV